jgi:hypothetical protein
MPGRGSPSIQQAITVDDAPGGLQVQSCTGQWLDIPSLVDGIGKRSVAREMKLSTVMA